MKRPVIALVVVAVAAAACGGGGGTAVTTTAPPSTTTTVAATGTWFDGLAVGVCFDDAFSGGDFDFSVPARIVPCDQAHDNEVVARIPLGTGAYPGTDAVKTAAAEACAPAYEGFLGRPLAETLMLGFTVHPEESDWTAGARDAICAVYGPQPVVGTSASAGLTAPGEFLAVYHEVDGDGDFWLVDAGTGALVFNITENDVPEVEGPPGWAYDGTALVYAAEVSPGDADILAVSPETGQTLILVDGPGFDDTPSLSPIGLLLAYISRPTPDADFDIYVLDLDTGETVRLTDDPGRESSPQWSIDGSKILYRSTAAGPSDIWVMNTDGTDQRRLTNNGGNNYDPRWSPDGTRILFTTDVGGNYDIWVMNADGTGARALTTHPANDEFPTWSSDGRYVAFQSTRYGGQTLWIMRADGSDQSLLTTLSPMAYPMFAPSNG